MSVAPSTARNRSTIRAVPKPTTRQPLQIGRHVAIQLAEAQGFAFHDIAADLEAADANDVADEIDRRRDEHIRQALRLVRLARLARHDRTNADGYLALADGHLREAIRADRIHDEHRTRGRRQITASIEAGRAVVGVHETLLTGRGEP